MNTTVTVAPGFAPMRAGEVIKIKNSNGKGVWRSYTVGAKLTGDRDSKEVVYSATMQGRID